MATTEFSFTQSAEINKGIQEHQAVCGLTEIPMLQSLKGYDAGLQAGL